MHTAQEIEASEFHDSQLTAMERTGSDVSLVFSNVLMDTAGEEYHRATVILRKVRQISRDGRPSPEIGLEGEGSSVIAFRRSGQTATLLLNWRHYSQRRDELVLYRFAFDAIRSGANRKTTSLSDPNGVRTDRGDPNISQPSQQEDHAVVRSGGNVVGREGTLFPDRLRKMPNRRIYQPANTRDGGSGTGWMPTTSPVLGRTSRSRLAETTRPRSAGRCRWGQRQM